MEYRIERWSDDSAPDAAELAGRMRAEGFDVFQWSDGVGSVYTDHEHDEDQSHWIISGSLELIVKDVGTIVLNAGDRDLMPAGTVHSARVLGAKPVFYLIGTRK